MLSSKYSHRTLKRVLKGKGLDSLAYALTGWKPLFQTMPVDKHVTLCEFLNHFDTPDNFQGLKSVLNSAEFIAKDLAKAKGQDFEVLNESSFIDLMKLNFEELSVECYRRYSQSNGYGIHTKNPLYVILLILNGDRSDFSQYVAYPVAALLLKQADLVLNRSPIYTLTKQLRRLILDNPSHLNGFDELSTASIIESVFIILMAPRDEMVGLGSKGHEYVSMLKDLQLESAVSLIRKTYVSSGGGGKGGGGKPKGAVIIGGNNQVSISRQPNLGGYSVIEGADVGEFRLEQYVNQDIFNLKGEALKLIEVQDHVLNISVTLPLENIVRATKRRLTRTENPSSELDVAKRKINAKYLADATIRANQRLLTNTSLLDEFTLEVLLIGINDWAQPKADISSYIDQRDKVHPTIASAVLATCLFRGMALEEVLSLKRLKGKTLTSKHYVLKESRSGLDTTGYWIEKVPLASMVNNNNSFNGTEKVATEYRLPMPKWLSQLILNAEKVREQYKQDSFVTSNEFKASFKKFGFVWTVSDFKLAFDRFFKRLRKANKGIEVNLKKVETYLLNASLHDYDATYSAYFTGNKTPHSQTKLFYTRLKEAEIQSKYVEFWEQRLIGLVGHNIDFQSLGEWLRIKTEEFVGSALVPRADVVKQINRAFFEQFKVNELSTSAELFKYHLQYSLYTLFFFSYATGYRGVHNILPNWRLISDDLKWVSISDKDDLDSSHARISYLSSMMRKQLANYFSHLKMVLGRLVAVDFDLYKLLIDAFRDWDQTLTYRKEGDRFVFDELTTPVFFNVNLEKRRVEPISLNYFLTQLHHKERVGLPANGGRHFLRTTALSESIPSDILDAFLGHFIYGHEPHSVYSGLNLSSLEYYFEPMMQRHLSHLGFKAVPSKLKG